MCKQILFSLYATWFGSNQGLDNSFRFGYAYLFLDVPLNKIVISYKCDKQT